MQSSGPDVSSSRSSARFSSSKLKDVETIKRDIDTHEVLRPQLVGAGGRPGAGSVRLPPRRAATTQRMTVYSATVSASPPPRRVD